MKEKLQLINNVKRIIFIFCLSIILSICGFAFMYKGKHNYINKVITYNENNNIDYKVYLKENNFFTEPYLPMNKTYIATLINYIDINFENKIVFNEKISGKYTYYLKGILTANEPNGDGEYFKKEYDLSDTITKEYHNLSNIAINKNIKIDYKKFNDILISFKNEFGLSMNGSLNVALVVENTVKNEYENRDVTKLTKIGLDIPLTSLTVEVPINYQADNKVGNLIETQILSSSRVYMVSKIIGYLCFTCSAALSIILIIIAILAFKHESLYKKKVRKILKTYDSIIVNINKYPLAYKENVVEVNNFNELIDAHGEIRKPINFVENISGATFILSGDKIIYVYKINRDLLVIKKNEKENY